MKFWRLLERTVGFKDFRPDLFILGIGFLIAFVESAGAIETKIAFLSTRDGNAEIYATDSDWTAPVRLTRHPAIDSHPAWSPDGSKIAFTSNRRNGSTNEIYIMDADGKRPVRLTTNRRQVPAFDESPSWSPDGRSIAFASNREGSSEIYAMDTNGKNIVQLTRTLAREATPSWSPDGSKIAYVSRNINADSDIYVMNADGTNPVRLTAERRWASEWRPSWSADGRKIAFASREPDGSADIYSINSDGSGLTNLTQTPHVNDLSPAWRPSPFSVSAVGKLATQWGRVKQSR